MKGAPGAALVPFGAIQPAQGSPSPCVSRSYRPGSRCHSGAIRLGRAIVMLMTKPRTGSMKERSPGRWKLQVTADPDPVSGTRRRLSRTVEGTSTEAREALQRTVAEAMPASTAGVVSPSTICSTSSCPGRRYRRRPTTTGWCHDQALEAGARRPAVVEAGCAGLRSPLRAYIRRRARRFTGALRARRLASRPGTGGPLGLAAA